MTEDFLRSLDEDRQGADLPGPEPTEPVARSPSPTGRAGYCAAWGAFRSPSAVVHGARRRYPGNLSEDTRLATTGLVRH